MHPKTLKITFGYLPTWQRPLILSDKQHFFSSSRKQLRSELLGLSSWGERNNKTKASTFHGAWFRLWIVGRDLNGLVLPINWNSFWTYRESRLEKVGIFGTSLLFPPPLPSNLFPLALQTYLQNFISNSKRIFSCDPIRSFQISFSSTLLFFFLKSHYGHRVGTGNRT